MALSLFNKMDSLQEYDLSTCSLFDGMTNDGLDEFVDKSVCEIWHIDKGERVVRQNDLIRYLILLVDGLVRTEMITKEGNVLEIEFLEPIRPLAPAFIFATNCRFPVDVIAMQPSVFYLIEKNVWLAEMMKNERLLTNFLRLNSNMTVFLSNKVQMMSIKSLKGKLSLYILENTTPQQPSFVIKRTQTQLAEYFGVQRPSLARTIGEMIEEGLITLQKKTLTVIDRKKLEASI